LSKKSKLMVFKYRATYIGEPIELLWLLNRIREAIKSCGVEVVGDGYEQLPASAYSDYMRDRLEV